MMVIVVGQSRSYRSASNDKPTTASSIRIYFIVLFLSGPAIGCQLEGGADYQPTIRDRLLVRSIGSMVY